MIDYIEATTAVRVPSGGDEDRVVLANLELDRDGKFQLSFTDFDFGVVLAETLMINGLMAIELGLILKAAVPEELGLT